MWYPATGSLELAGASQLSSTSYVVAAAPVPLSATDIVPPIEQLLASATVPVAAPVVAGSNCTSSADVCPGFRVIGNFAPGRVNPAPVTEPVLMVTGAVPVDDIVTDCVAGVLRLTEPKATLLLPKVSVGVVAFRVRAKVFEIPLAVAVSVAIWFVLAAVAVAVKLALVAPAAMVTEPGTVTAPLLLARLTAVALVAAEVRVTVHASVPAPVSDPLLQESALKVAGVWPIPLRLIAMGDALLLIVTDPVNVPAVAGSKLIVNVAVCFGLSVRGKAIPESPNPVPAIAAPLIVNATVPEDVKVTVFVTAVFSASVPNATLVLLKVSADVAAFRVRAKVFETPLAIAVSVAVWLVPTAIAVAVKLALVAPAAIVTEPGTVTAPLLLTRVAVVAPVAADVRVTVHASGPAPVSDPLLQESALNVGVTGACPVPLRLIAAVAALLLIEIEPVNEPTVAGSKLMVSAAVWPGFSVSGNPTPESPNPVPATEAPLIVSAAVPEEVSVTVFVVAVFRATLPNATLVELTVSPGVVAPPEAGVSLTVTLLETLPDLAVMVTDCTDLTAATGAVN
jgi:hypothetical protein